MKFFVFTILSLVCLSTWAVPFDANEDPVPYLLEMKQKVRQSSDEALKMFMKIVETIPAAADIQGVFMNTLDYARQRVDDLCQILPNDPAKDRQYYLSLVADAAKDLDTLSSRAAFDIKSVNTTLKDFDKVQRIMDSFIVNVWEAMRV